jgi:lipoprotein-anchoring transpeptidase ErfK/SrfK
MRVRASLLMSLAAAGAVAASSAPASSPHAGEPTGPGEPSATAALARVTVQPEARPAPRGPRPHRLAVVRGEVGLSNRPGGPARATVGSTTEFGSRHVLGVAARRGDWLGVVTTTRPNNRLAWVRRGSAGLTMRRTRWSLHADLSARTLTLRKGARRVHRMTVAIGRPGSETPTGRFAVTDMLSGSRFGPYYGCCILALSGHQPNTPPGWTGGNRLAIHGTDAPSTIGAAASAGCLRGADRDLQVLMRKVPLGTPVFIRR